MSSAELTLVVIGAEADAAARFVTSLEGHHPTGVDVLNLNSASNLAETVRVTLGQVTTPYIAFTDGTSPEGEHLAAALEHAQKVSERRGLGDSHGTLLALSDWRDRDVVAAFGEVTDGLDAYLYLLPFHNVSVSLHGIDVQAGGTVARLVGTCRRGGTDGPEPADHRVVLRFLEPGTGNALEFETEPQLRFEDGAERWTGFAAEIPIDALPIGTSPVEIELCGPPGHEGVRRPLRGSVGMLSASRPIVSGGRHFQFVPVGATDMLEVVARRAPAPFARLRWAGAMIARDLRAVARRRAFAWVRAARLLTRPFFGRGTIWLVGERPGTARDNGYHLFAHLRRERPDIRAYYVIDRSSEQYPLVAELGRVVDHSSWKHRLLMLHAAVVANAYSIKHMVPRQWAAGDYLRHFAWRVGAYRIYLKHGVNVNTKALRRRVGGYDLYLTVSDAESTASRRTSAYDRQIVQTGLPRFDALVPTPPSRTILFMPTWRLYLAGSVFNTEEQEKVPFDGSTYQQFVLGLLSSPRLEDLLTRHDYHLKFMPHYNLREHLSDLTVEADRITILDGAAANIQDVMRECDLFITDHSSVHFDLAYLGTPMVYAHFDAEEYAAGHAEASWFDHERDGFGPVTYDLDSTIDALEHYLVNGCTREELYSQRAAAAFAFHDRDNSRRAVEAIENLVRTRAIR
jgi:hypothetical protein